MNNDQLIAMYGMEIARQVKNVTRENCIVAISRVLKKYKVSVKELDFEYLLQKIKWI